MLEFEFSVWWKGEKNVIQKVHRCTRDIIETVLTIRLRAKNLCRADGQLIVILLNRLLVRVREFDIILKYPLLVVTQRILRYRLGTTHARIHAFIVATNMCTGWCKKGVLRLVEIFSFLFTITFTFLGYIN